MSEQPDPTRDERDLDPDAVDHTPLERSQDAIDEAKSAAGAAVGHGATVGIPDDDERDATAAVPDDAGRDLSYGRADETEDRDLED